MTRRTLTSAGYLAAPALALAGLPLLSSDTPAVGVALYTAALLVFLASLALSQRAELADTCYTRRETQLDAFGATREAELLYRRDLKRAQLVADILAMRELARAERDHAPSVSGVRSCVRTASEVHEETLAPRRGKRGTK